jgi:transcriptional regulator with XRE-family HTH domain
MGRASRLKPTRLAEKLLRIRKALNLSQGRLIVHLGLADVIHPGYVSGYENGRREPSLLVLLAYARAAGVCMDVLIDDALDLPDRLPAIPRHKGMKAPAAPMQKPQSAPRRKR